MNLNIRKVLGPLHELGKKCRARLECNDDLGTSCEFDGDVADTCPNLEHSIAELPLEEPNENLRAKNVVVVVLQFADRLRLSLGWPLHLVTQT